jgi:ribosomal protein S18 acetylase RimI-like enzyme
VLDLTLLPEYRGRGIGTTLLRAVIAEAERDRVPVRLTVAVDNGRARVFYERLGFEAVGEDAARTLLERR